MLNIPTPPPKQVLLRLPDDVAAKLARAVPSRQRNRYIVDLLKRDLLAEQEAENRMMAHAADRMNELEAQYPELAREADEWVHAELTESVEVWDPDFDRATFERDCAEAQAAKRKSKTLKCAKPLRERTYSGSRWIPFKAPKWPKPDLALLCP